jgi:competence protein ComEC
MRKSNLLIFFIILLKLKYAETPIYQNFWVAWNTGQGQWVTHITNENCLHFDAGGEFGSFKRIRKSLFFYCGNKSNQIYLSHWDTDHFLNIPSMARSFPQLCWQKQPVAFSEKTSAQKIMQLQISFCQKMRNSVFTWIPTLPESTNESSQVFVEQNVLLPGDSPIKQEKMWTEQLQLNAVKVLILGHHGSRTSTGQALLKKLTNVSMAIASARFAKYHHPHPETLRRLSDFNIPVLKTEDWGNIWFSP